MAPPIFIQEDVAAEIARRLAPATRHLGLEKVLARLNRLERESADAPPVPVELVFTDTGEQLEIDWRCLLYTSPSPRDKRQSRMPSSA